MNEKAAISKLTITIGELVIDLTLEQARELKRVLIETLEPRSESRPTPLSMEPPKRREKKEPINWTPMSPPPRVIPVNPMTGRPYEITCTAR